ncbi:MAG: LytTR family DNA-binding domain-containing protein [Oscillospiraceae bacterium]
MIIIRIIIEDCPSDGEDEIIIRCREIDDSLMRFISTVKSGSDKLTCYDGDSISMISPSDIYYFESVDNKVFAYCESKVYEMKTKLYQLEKQFEYTDYLRISKSVIINVDKIMKITPSFSGRLEAVLKNGETVIISRQYVSDLKKKLGV